jgi:hypothetical protein
MCSGHRLATDIFVRFPGTWMCSPGRTAALGHPLLYPTAPLSNATTLQLNSPLRRRYPSQHWMGGSPGCGSMLVHSAQLPANHPRCGNPPGSSPRTRWPSGRPRNGFSCRTDRIRRRNRLGTGLLLCRYRSIRGELLETLSHAPSRMSCLVDRSPTHKTPYTWMCS